MYTVDSIQYTTTEATMPNQVFTPVKPTTLRETIVDTIRNAIINGQLKAGEHLKETVIAEQMSVSRSPIREAFRELEQEGLIKSTPNQGCYVRSFTENDIHEIFTLRATLEGLAGEILIKDQCLSPEDFQQLETYIAQQEQAIAARDLNRLTKLDMEFHWFLCARTGFTRLVKMWQGLSIQMQVLFNLRFQARPDFIPQTVHTDHIALINALRAGDVAEFTRFNKEINARVAQECVAVIGLTH